jgi:small conductance mechanosensitive channel
MNFSFQKYGDQFIAWGESALPRLVGAVLILAIGWWASNLLVRLMYRAMKRSKADTGIVTFLCSSARAFLKIIVCITAAAQLGMNVNSIIAALGAAGLTIGLALKDSMSNIASGAQIIFTKPFRVGDYLALADVEGTVERIETMFTTLKTFDNKKVIIPNSKITVSVITNYSAMETRRLDLNYIVGYSEDLAAVKNVLGELVNQNSMILGSPDPLVVVGEHQEIGITMGVRVWCKTEDYWNLYFDMQEKVKLAFDKAGIAIPCRQMDVHMNTTAERNGE